MQVLFTRLDGVLLNPALASSLAARVAGPVLEFVWFGLTEARACLFAFLFFAAMVMVPRAGIGPLPRYDVLLIVALAIQGWMLWARLETVDEAKAICVFHAIGFALETNDVLVNAQRIGLLQGLDGCVAGIAHSDVHRARPGAPRRA